MDANDSVRVAALATILRRCDPSLGMFSGPLTPAWQQFWLLLADNPDCHIIHYCCAKAFKGSTSIRAITDLIDLVAGERGQTAEAIRSLSIEAFADLLLPRFISIATRGTWRPPIGTPTLSPTERLIIERLGDGTLTRRQIASKVRNEVDKHVLAGMARRHLLTNDGSGYRRTPRAVLALMAPDPQKPGLRSKYIGARQARGLTQDELARITGISRSAICRFENGETNLPPARHRAIDRALGLIP